MSENAKRAARSDIVHVRLSPEVKAELQALADQDDRTISAYVARLITAHLEEVKKRT